MFCFRVIPVNPAFVTSDYRGHEVRIVSARGSGLAHGGQCKLTRNRPSAPLSGDGAQFRWHTSHLKIFSQNFLARTECYSNILCNLFDSQTSVSANDSTHMCHGLLGVGGGRPAWAGFVFKGSASIFETGIPLKCLRST